MTKFQKEMTKEKLIPIVKAMHHALTEEQIEKNLKWFCQYTWVSVQFRVRGYGFVSFAIDNHHSTLMGPIDKKKVEFALSSNKIQTKIWRFVDDEIYKREQQIEEWLRINTEQPSVEEFYDIYMEED